MGLLDPGAMGLPKGEYFYHYQYANNNPFGGYPVQLKLNASNSSDWHPTRLQEVYSNDEAKGVLKWKSTFDPHPNKTLNSSCTISENGGSSCNWPYEVHQCVADSVKRFNLTTSNINGFKSGDNKDLPLAKKQILSIVLVSVLAVLLFTCGKRYTSPNEDSDLFSISSSIDGKALYLDILRATKDFNEMYRIGEGRFGTVYKAKIPSSRTVAVKKLHSSAQIVYRGSSFNQFRALTMIRHRNIVKLHDFCSNVKHTFLVYEYLERGSLSKMLSREEEAKKLNWKTRVKIVRGIAQGLSYMHHDCSPRIVHGNISSSNILLDADFEPRISDFGTAKLLSFGVLTLEIIMGKHPGDSIDVIKFFSERLDPRLPQPENEEERALIYIDTMARICLNPKTRPTMQVIADMLAIVPQ
nr:MDIS1-interacting receptor like kinase 2-like isoform X2 [Ipomoea batatas]